MRTGVALLCVALGAGAAGFVAYRHLSAPPIVTTTASAGARGTALGSAPSAAAPAAPTDATDGEPTRRAVPDVVPDASLPDLAGHRHSLREYQGRPTVFNFWATWCAPCRREIPLLNALHRTYAGQKLQIVGIAIDFKDAVAAYAKSTNLDYPLLVGEEEGLKAAAAFGIDVALPFSVFVASNGHIVAAKLGELHRDEADVIISAVMAVDAGKLPLAEARTRISQQLQTLALIKTSVSLTK